MSHLHTFTKRAILGLTALTVALALLVSAACSANEMNPTPSTDRGDQTLEEKIDQLNKEIANLRQEVEELQSAEGQEMTQRTARAEPSATQPARTPTTTAARQQATTEPAPTRVTIPAPAGPGICGRSPEIQKAILDRLDIPLCQVTSKAELFRIESMNPTMDTVRPGDFEGLVNIKEIAIMAKNIEPGGLSGLVNIERMELTVHTYGSIAPGALQGLNNLETLRIKTNKKYPEPEDTITLPEFDLLPKLKNLEVGWFERKPKSRTPFQNLPNLESAVISIGFRTEDPEGKEFQIHHNMFANNPKLKFLKIQLNVWAPEKMKINIPVNLFSNNPLLEEIKINSERVRLPRDLFKHLEELKQLNLNEYWTDEEGWEKQEIVLSKSSPLYNKITYGDAVPYGYTLTEEPEE